MQNHLSFFYTHARLPSDRRHFQSINHAAETLAEKMAKLDLAALPISDYNRRYFGKHIRERRASLQYYTQLLAWAVAFHQTSLKDFVLVDYGGGSGLFSFLAKQAGIGTVIYNDIYDVSCHDAKSIGEALGTGADHYVCGDENALLSYLSRNALTPRAITSFDVIEHVYEIEPFLDKLCTVSKEPLSLVLASSANTLNPRTRWLTMKHHRRLELDGTRPAWGHKERDTLKPYLKAREEILSARFPQISSDRRRELALRTRGLMEPQIVRCAETFLANGTLPPEPGHPTNTCDPFTGNWAEHLMDPHALMARIASHGFQGEVLAGGYACKGGGLKRAVGRTLNMVIANSEGLGLRLAPHYVLFARNFAS